MRHCLIVWLVCDWLGGLVVVYCCDRLFVDCLLVVVVVCCLIMFGSLMIH